MSKLALLGNKIKKGAESYSTSYYQNKNLYDKIWIKWKWVEKFLYFLYVYSINNHYTHSSYASCSPPFDKNVHAPDMAGLFASYADYKILEWISSHY